MDRLMGFLRADWFGGNRTKILAAIIIVGLNSALALGWINQEMFDKLLSVFVGLGLLTASVHKPKE